MKSESVIDNISKMQNSTSSKSESTDSFFDRLFHRTITDRDRAEFCTQLAVMLEARISLHRALEVLTQQTKNKRLKNVIEGLKKDIHRGNSFDRALAHQGKAFDNLFVVTAEVGQESGRLGDVLLHLAQHLEKMNSLQRKFLHAMTYPALVLSVAAGAVSFLLIFIVPAFAEMFKSFQVELPASTKVILFLSEQISKYGLYFLATVVLAVYVLRNVWRRPDIKSRIQSIIFRIPFVGDAVLKTHVARFCRTLGTLLRAQVSLVDALDVTQRMATIAEIKSEIQSIEKHVRQGRAIVDPLIESKLFPPMVVQMIAVGEETSELDTMLLKVAEYYEKELDSKVEALSSVMEPVIVLFLSIIVAAILISMYMPMFDLVNVISGG